MENEYKYSIDDDYYYDDYNDEIDDDLDYTSYQDDIENDDNYDYYYDDNGNSSPNRNKIIKIVMIAITIVVVLFTGTKIFNTALKNKDDDETNVASVSKKESPNINKDIEKVKDQILKYYKEENLPTNSGDKENLTLKQLKKKNVVTISSIESYDLNKSYSLLEKLDDKYNLKIYLKTNKKSKLKEYIINHYNYCGDTYLCEEVKISESENNEDTTLEEDTSGTSTKNKTYLYKYVKKDSSDNKLSNWSKWNSYQKTSCDTTATSCDANDQSCLEEVKLYQRKERVGSYNKIYQTNRNTIKLSDKKIVDACQEYDYVVINNTYYQVPLNSKYYDVANLTSSTMSNYGNFIYNGRGIYQTPPSDTITTRYVYVGVDDSNCSDTCQSLPRYIYDRYTFNKSIQRVDSITNCKNKSAKALPIYDITSSDVSIGRTEGVYATVCYSSNRTRTIITGSNSKVLWSSYNDQAVINKGYIYTGEKKEK